VPLALWSAWPNFRRSSADSSATLHWPTSECLESPLVQFLLGTDKLRTKINEHLAIFRDRAIAEIAQRQRRTRANIDWPSPRGDASLARLRALANNLPQFSVGDIDAAIASAENEWERHLPSPWAIVRGKWILPALNREISDFRSGEALMSALLARRPENVTIQAFATLVRQLAKRA
jgi:hypothetical protein